MPSSMVYRLRVLSHLLAVAIFGVVAFLAPAPWGAVAGVGALMLLAAAGFTWLRLHRQVTRIASEWQLTVDTVDFPLATVDADGQVVRMNRAAMLRTGRGYVENLGRPLAELGDGEPWRTAARLIDELGGSQAVAAAHPAAEGRSWEVSVHPVRVGGVRPRLLVLGRDVTERVRLESELRRREVMSTLGALVGNVAHEARSPLYALQAGLDSLRSRQGDHPDLGPHLDLLTASAEQLQGLMRALLDYGKPIRDELAPGHLPQVARRAVEDTHARAAARSVRVDLASGDGLPAVAMDEERVFQVLRNLVDNAVEHAAEGGAVTVRCRGENGRVECVVSDDGAGFADDDLARVFEPFFSRRAGGTGLGLAIVQRVIEQHGGGVEAGNAPQGGGRVRVWLPTPQIA